MDLTTILGTEPVADAEEGITETEGSHAHSPTEAFVIFSQDIPSQSLGFIDSQASTLEISVSGHDLVIHQSRGLLTSDRKEGTTGAVVWKVTPLFANWLLSPTNPLSSLLTPSSTVLELGAGVSGIVALALGPKVACYTATDQDYVLKLLRQNIAGNLETVFHRPNKGKKTVSSADRISVQSLDWETDSVSQIAPVDLIIACDCIYNESLIEPLNSTCAALCRLAPDRETPTLCLIAQQLRSPDVFEAWLKSFCDKFHVWQVPDAMLSEGLREGSGFVVHVGIAR